MLFLSHSISHFTVTTHSSTQHLHHYEPRLIPQLGNKMLERWASGLNSKEDLSGLRGEMKVWYFWVFSFGADGVVLCVGWVGKNTLYHCVWCFASVSAFSHEDREKWIWLRAEQHGKEWVREGKSETESEIWKLVHIFWRLAYAPLSQPPLWLELYLYMCVYMCCFRL